MPDLACEVCQKRIEHGQDVVKIEVGKRNTGLHPRYTNPASPGGYGAVHIECINVEHDEEYPEKTAYTLAQRIDESGDDE